MPDAPIRVLVVDDTAVYRRIVIDALEQLPNVEVVGRAANGLMALAQIDQLRPDIVTLDVEMPVMDGLETLREIQRRGLSLGVIMISARSPSAASATVTALELGALDFVLKPEAATLAENAAELCQALASRIVSLGRVQRIRRALGTVPAARSAGREPARPGGDGRGRVQPRHNGPDGRPTPRIAAQPHVVAIGISTGGPQTLQQFLPRLPGDFPVPVLVVQHMPPIFTRSLADDLDRRCAVSVCEAAHGQLLQPGCVYIAPGGRQMKIGRNEQGVCVVVNDDPRENSCRPSADYLFRSVVDVYGAHVLALIMTGMGNDGTSGCRLICQRGGSVFAQDEASCVVFGMPRQPIDEGLADVVGPPERLAAEVLQRVRRKEAACR